MIDPSFDYEIIEWLSLEIQCTEPFPTERKVKPSHSPPWKGGEWEGIRFKWPHGIIYKPKNSLAVPESKRSCSLKPNSDIERINSPGMASPNGNG